MRKDPPFDMEYIYTTYILELAEKRGLMVVRLLPPGYGAILHTGMSPSNEP